MRRSILPALLICALATPSGATEVKVFLAQTQAAFLKGTLDSVSVDPLGRLRLAHRASRVTGVEEPFLLAAAAHPDGWVVGTGNAGRVILVRRDGTQEILFETAEPEVFAVWAADDGTVFAGSSPDGKVYRYRDGEVEELWSPGETYIWRIQGDGGGRLLVATGTEGRLYVVDPSGRGTVLYDADDDHLRSLSAPLADGSVLVGTAGEGLVLEVAPDGSAHTLYDAAEPEIVAFASDGDGGAYFAAVASEASFVDLGAARSESRNGSGENGGNRSDDDSDEDSVEAQGSPDVPAAGSRPAGFSGARSRILRWTPAGGVREISELSDDTVYSLLWQQGRLWLGTGQEGKLYSLQNDQLVLEKDVDESQIVSLLAGDAGPTFATTNNAAIYRFTGGNEREGTLTSDVLDTKQLARFGTLHWRGQSPRGTHVRFSFRRGLSARPDSTWSEWTEPAEGMEIALHDLDPARYLQWRAHLEGRDDTTPEIQSVEISYLQTNQRPRVRALDVMPPGQVLVPGNFNPANQIFEPAHPNRDGIFTTLEPPKGTNGRSNLKALWKAGYRTLRWKASDPNDDPLSYRLEVRREDDADGWVEMVDDLREEYYGFDATALPDGYYRFRLTTSDAPGNVDEDALEDSRISELVTIDHSPPTIRRVSRSGDTLRVEISDPLSILRESVVSVDAGPWEDVEASDGLLDARNETLLVPLPEGASLLLVRLTDAALNVMTYDLSEQLP